MYYTYMIRCLDNSIYTGMTNNIDKRLSEHINNKGAKYTKSHQALKLEAVWRCKEKSLACKLEYQIKQLSKIQKEDIIKGEKLSKYLKGKIDSRKFYRINIGGHVEKRTAPNSIWKREPSHFPEKLNKLFLECINDLNKIGIDILNEKKYGKIDISISKRNNKRYGCCRQDKPDANYMTITKKGKRKIVKYEKFNIHHIEISPWVMELNDDIIKNTIMHELIHCMPFCNNHGLEFKKIAKTLNLNFNYNISRVGNKKNDFEKSSLEYEENKNYNYKIICKGCNQNFFRQRLNKNFTKKYRCGKCGSTFEIIKKL